MALGKNKIPDPVTCTIQGTKYVKVYILQKLVSSIVGNVLYKLNGQQYIRNKKVKHGAELWLHKSDHVPGSDLKDKRHVWVAEQKYNAIKF